MSEKMTLSGVPETMLQTIYARAKETKTRGGIYDQKAVMPNLLGVSKKENILQICCPVFPMWKNMA